MMISQTDPEPAKPFLRWAGSKRTVLPKLREFLPKNIPRYLEPFAGSACLFFSTSPLGGVLGDLNHDLIDTFKVVRDRPADVAKILASMQVGEDEYYRVRGIDPAALSPHRRAARFIYLNRFCFNGLYRTNSAGKFNVPYGRPKTSTVPTAAELKRCASLLARVDLVTSDFERTIRDNLLPGDLVYMDPPFYRSTRRVFRQYTAKPFGADDLSRLSKLLKFIDRRNAHFVVSYSSCQEAKDAFAGWPRYRIRTHRSISGSAIHRRMSEEFVITNVPQLHRPVALSR